MNNFLDKINLWVIWLNNTIIRPIFGRVIIFEILSFLLFIAISVLLVIFIVKFKKAKTEAIESKKQEYLAVQRFSKAKEDLEKAHELIKDKLKIINNQRQLIERQEKKIQSNTKSKGKKANSEDKDAQHN